MPSGGSFWLVRFSLLAAENYVAAPCGVTPLFTIIEPEWHESNIPHTRWVVARLVKWSHTYAYVKPLQILTLWFPPCDIS